MHVMHTAHMHTAHMYVHVCASMITCALMPLRTCTHSGTHHTVLMHMCAHKHKYMHACKHTCARTHTHADTPDLPGERHKPTLSSPPDPALLSGDPESIMNNPEHSRSRRHTCADGKTGEASEEDDAGTASSGRGGERPCQTPEAARALTPRTEGTRGKLG